MLTHQQNQLSSSSLIGASSLNMDDTFSVIDIEDDVEVGDRLVAALQRKSKYRAHQLLQAQRPSHLI